MFPIDFPTVFFSYLITNIVSLVVIVLLFLQIRKRFPGTTNILLAFVFNTLGTALIFIRDTIPDWISMSVANTFIFSAGIVMLIGLQQFFGKRSSQFHNYILVFIYFILHFYFSYFSSVLFTRLLISSFVLLYIFSQIAWFMLKRTPVNMRQIARGVGFTFCAFSIIYVWRILFLFITNQTTTSYFNSNNSEIWFVISNQVVFLFLAYNISLMYNKRLLFEISRQEEKFRELIKNSFDMIILLDSKGIQHYVSESCEKILGYKSDELINFPIIEKMIHPEDQEIAEKGLKGIFENSGIGGTQYRHRHKNGHWVYLEAFGNNQVNNPVIQSVVLNVRDISERKTAELALKENELRLNELNATKDKFFSIIAHDLKSPFNGIVGFSDLLCEQVQLGSSEGIAKHAEIIRDSSKRAMDLLTNLMEWSRSQTGILEFNPQAIDMLELINETTKLLNDTAGQKAINILKVLPEKADAFADKEMISTVLRNLISNAVKFTNPGGDIVISAEQKQGELLVTVKDKGVGIERNDLEKLFRIEETHSTSGTNNEKGTGLGLILCKDFIEKHDGEIWMESEVGQGSTFYFTIPKYK